MINSLSSLPWGNWPDEGLHLKTAGTSWLEAMRLIAKRAPSLYREMHQYAFTVFHEAAKLYYVTTDLGKIPKLQDEETGTCPSIWTRMIQDN